MKGQEYTVMNYLVWAVFFVAVMAGVYMIFKNRIVAATPTPVEQIFDVIRSANMAYETGIEKNVCLERVYPGGSIVLTKEMIKKRTGFSGDIVFECRGSGCEATDDSMELKDRTGTLCAWVDRWGTLHVVWR